MKASAVVLLVAALCAGTALSLHCYKCQDAKSHGECKDTVKCMDLDRVCVTLEHRNPAQELLISKWCAPECPAFTSEIKVAKANFSSNCCEMDYCNSGGPSSVKTSHALVAVATLASFAYILRTGL
ncbi:lymphocyte antigen 6D-like [Varanus komodoensis]|uniref:lymphocyte antigen 6D-like n=1 Tax=Varanus komodoensis TaxID=61221 RepID=UPI001CF7BE54|nr:lymphocyte antigen 6D-like [Varanus komodoensis]